jgi:hypothetical protein
VLSLGFPSAVYAVWHKGGLEVIMNNEEAQPLVGIVNHLSQDVSGTVCGIRFDFRSNIEFEYGEAINHALTVT